MTDSPIELDELAEAIMCGKIQQQLYADPRVKFVNDKLLNAAVAYMEIRLQQPKPKNRYRKIIDKYFPSHNTQQQRQTESK